MIACCATIGIGKRELFEDYYMDEIHDVLYEYGELNNAEQEAEEVESGEFFCF